MPESRVAKAASVTLGSLSSGDKVYDSDGIMWYVVDSTIYEGATILLRSTNEGIPNSPFAATDGAPKYGGSIIESVMLNWVAPADFTAYAKVVKLTDPSSYCSDNAQPTYKFILTKQEAEKLSATIRGAIYTACGGSYRLRSPIWSSDGESLWYGTHIVYNSSGAINTSGGKPSQSTCVVPACTLDSNARLVAFSDGYQLLPKYHTLTFNANGGSF